MKAKNKKNQKKKNNFFNTLKPILIFSFIINIILLCYVYYLKTTNHLYVFAGDNEYMNVESGVLSLNYDINLLAGNSIEYIAEEDINIKEIKIGYYILEDENLNEIISYYSLFEESESLKKVINDITSLNVSESNQAKQMFKKINSKNIENNLYLVMEIKTEKNEKIVSKLQLDVSKIK